MTRLKCAVLSLALMLCLPLSAQQREDGPTQLLDHLAGKWVLQGVLGAKQTTHDVTADWILKHEYLRFHEVSREKNKDGSPAYEAIVILTRDTKANEYKCLWLDNTAGGGLSVPAARGEMEGSSMSFIFPPPYEALHTTFTYDSKSDVWHLTIDEVKDGKTDRFGDVTLVRPHRTTSRR